MESVGRLAGGVAHDFNNLLTVINGYSELLAARLGNDRGLQEMAEQILRAGKSAAELTKQLLTFSRKQVAQARPLDLNVVVAEAQKMFSRILGEDVQLESRLSPSLGQVVADPGQMHQVLMNLVVNARDSMPGGGKLTIETRNVEVNEGFSRQHPEVAAGKICVPGSNRHRDRDERGSQTADFRAILHDEGKRQRNRAGAGYGVRHCAAQRRLDPGGKRTRRGHHVSHLSTADRSSGSGRRNTPASVVAKGSETVLLVEDEDAVRELTDKC